MTRRPPRAGMTLASLRLALKGDLACNVAPLDRLTVAVFRIGQYAIAKPAPVRLAWSILDLVYTRLLIGAELPAQVRCGPRLTLLHAGRGVILHPDVRLGADARIYHRVTIGIRGQGLPPVLGDRVYVGSGAAILGPVTVGDDARIGAGAVVTKDVPPGFTARGVPAVMIAPGMAPDDPMPERPGSDARLAVEAAAAGLAFGSLLLWASTCLVGSFRPQGLANPYWRGVPWLRTDTSGFAAFIVAAVCLLVSEYLRLRRRRRAAPAGAAPPRTASGAALLAMAASETVAVLATGLFGYLSVNVVTHPATQRIQATHLLSWPTEGTLRVVALLLCIVSVGLFRYLRPRTVVSASRRPAPASRDSATAPGRSPGHRRPPG